MKRWNPYFRRLEKRQGLLVIHTSNRYSTLTPVVGATAHTLGWSTLSVFTEISKTTPDLDWDADGRITQYLIVCRHWQLKPVLDWLPAEEDDARVKRTLKAYDPVPPGRAVIWTDDRHAALDALDLRRYLSGR